MVINYVRRKVKLLLGLERKARTDPKAHPRTPREDDRAEAATAAKGESMLAAVTACVTEFVRDFASWPDLPVLRERP